MVAYGVDHGVDGLLNVDIHFRYLLDAPDI